MSKRKTGAILALAAAFASTVGAGSASARTDPGFKTTQAPMIAPVAPGVTAEPIITVGETLPSGYMFESIPDGISIGRINGRGSVDILVNHELSLVPFAGRSDFTNSIVSKLRLSQHGAGVLKGRYVIPSSANYQRFCSNFVVGPEHGFERSLLLTNEEARDIVLREGTAWHPPSVSLTEPSAEQAGVVVAYDIKGDTYRSIYGMGRHNHENDVGLPGYGHPVVLSGDDTFDAPASQLYVYSASSGEALWNDEGTLYAFRSDNSAINDYGDMTLLTSIPGEFIPVPPMIATGKRADGTDVTSADFGYPAPPSAAIPDGPQWVLEHWSNQNNVFQFIRVEDIAYDRTHGNVVYFADTGEPRAVADPATTRLRRGSTSTGPYMNGRLFKIVLDPANPLEVLSLTILPGADFDAGGYNNAAVPHQPDNVETTESGILFQEDTGSHNAQPRFPGATNARIWRYDLATGTLTVVAEVDQSMSPVTNKGSFESSGIVDVSAVFGPDTFLADVQAHGWELSTAPGPGFNFAREAGQLLLLKVPGA